jgi:hypothetical protein
MIIPQVDGKMKKNAGRLFLLILVAILVTGCGGNVSNKRLLKISTSPPNALVCTGAPAGNDSFDITAVAGETPLEKNFEFGNQERLWLQIEKRGYVAHRLAVDADSGTINVDLQRLLLPDGTPAPEFAMPVIRKVLLPTPDFTVIRRGFSGEASSPELSGLAQRAIMEAIAQNIISEWKVEKPDDGGGSDGSLRTLWRDVRTALETVDPIRLKHTPKPLCLETSSARKAAQRLGRDYHSDAILFVDGRQVEETASMVAGKVGMSVIGTANSYAGGYSRAMAGGDSFFVYEVYTPSFAEGAQLKAMLIDSNHGEIIWTNRGLWPRIAFRDKDAVLQIIRDLLAGLPVRQGEL